MAGEALTKGQIVMALGIGSLFVAGMVVWSFSRDHGGGAPMPRACTLQIDGAQVPILPSRDAALAAYGAGLMGRAEEKHIAGAAWAPSGTVASILEESAGALRIATPKGTGWVAWGLCR